jgi:predicted enzyme related to lactoylglutathione lyase
VIAVHDLGPSARYYRDVLGFDVRMIGDPGWRFFVRDQYVIMAGQCPDALSPHELGDHSCFAYLEADEIDAFHQAVTAKGGTVIKPLRTSPGACASSGFARWTDIASCSGSGSALPADGRGPSPIHPVPDAIGEIHQPAR